MIVRRSQYDLRQAEARRHVLEGLLIALRNLDAVIKLIRGSKDAEAARTGLMNQFKLTQVQAQAILDLTLRRLTSLERDKIEAEHKETLEAIARLQAILSDEREQMRLIAAELTENITTLNALITNDVAQLESELRANSLSPFAVRPVTLPKPR